MPKANPLNEEDRIASGPNKQLLVRQLAMRDTVIAQTVAQLFLLLIRKNVVAAIDIISLLDECTKDLHDLCQREEVETFGIEMMELVNSQIKQGMGLNLRTTETKQ